MVAGTKFANCDEKPWDNCEFGKFKSGKICLQIMVDRFILKH